MGDARRASDPRALVDAFYLYLNGDAKGPTYGLVKNGKLKKALKSAEFVRFAERMAGAYLERKRDFGAVTRVAEMALQGNADARH